MKPYDKSNSFMRRVTKRVAEFLPGTTWMNSLLSDSQSDDDPASTSERDDQPPVKKLCTSNNTFSNSNNRTCIDTNLSMNSTENHNSSHSHAVLPTLSSVSCLPSTSRQSPKFVPQSRASLLVHDPSNRNSLKKISDVADLSNINRQNPNTLAFNFASSTPTLVPANKQLNTSSSLKRSYNSDKLFTTITTSKLNKSRGVDSTLKFNETRRNTSSPSFRWDTFVNYGELSERQKLFAQKSPLNCSRVMYGGSSACSNLSKLLGNTPPIHRKAVIPISPANNTEIRTTSSILLGHISTKDKEIEENKFIIQPRVQFKHKAEQKSIPVKVETTLTIVDTTPEKTDDKSIDNFQICTGRDSSRKLRANISKKTRGLKSEELEMPTIVNLPNISLPMSKLPNIKLSSSNNDEDNEFTFNQPLTLEQFSLQIAEKTSKKKHKMILKKTLQNTDTSSKNQLNFSEGNFSSLSNFSTQDTLKNDAVKVTTIHSETKFVNSIKNHEVSELCNLNDKEQDTLNKSTQSSSSKFESTKPINIVFDKSSQGLESNKNIQQLPEMSSVENKKWTCDTCWVSNNSDKINCVACQTSKPGNSLKPLQIAKPSTWTCQACWVPNKNESNECIACQTLRPGTIKKVVEQSSNWTCDACWVKNKNDSTSCISCGTVKPGSILENKSQASTQFKFGFNNNTFENTSSSQFKFGFDNGKTDVPSSQFKHDSDSILKTSENGKTDISTPEFKFGVVNSKSDPPLGSFKFGDDSSVNQPIHKLNELSNSNNTDKSLGQFKFGFEKKSDQPENQFNFGGNATSKSPVKQPETQFKFGVNTATVKSPAKLFKCGLNNIETDKTVNNNLGSDSNTITKLINESENLVNNKDDTFVKTTELPNNKNFQFKFGDKNIIEKSTPQLTFGFTEPNSNHLSSLVGQKNEDISKSKIIWDKKTNNVIKSITFGLPQTIQPAIGSTNTEKLVNGHSDSNEISSEDQKPCLIKTSQLFSFGSLAKQDQNLPDDHKKMKSFTFGSATNDKSFASPTITTSNFSSTGPVFGATNSIFGSGPTTSTPVTLGASSLPTPQFSFGAMAPPVSNNFLKTVNENDKKTLTQTTSSFTSPTNMTFSFGAQSPAFSVGNTEVFPKSSVQVDNQTKTTPNIFNQSNIKPTVKLDPNAPISINFTGGATTQFTAQPETTEPPPKRKILKPVRRIR